MGINSRQIKFKNVKEVKIMTFLVEPMPDSNFFAPCDDKDGNCPCQCLNDADSPPW